MKLISVLDHLAAAPATPPAPRRALLAQLGRAAAAALPVGLAARPAAAAPTDTPFDAVTQLLLLERVQQAFYTQALAVPGLVPAAQVPGFQRLLLHQTQHAAFLTLALQNAGAALPPAPAFDFSGRRGVATNPVLFPNVLSAYDEFLALAQQLEDLGVRLYQGRAFAIASDNQLAGAVRRMYAVEARHSAHVRGLRQGRGVAVKTWPSPTDDAIVRPPAAQALTLAATGGEDNTTQYLTAGIPVPFAYLLPTNGSLAVQATAVAEAFDEPITGAAAQAALDLFS